MKSQEGSKGEEYFIELNGRKLLSNSRHDLNKIVVETAGDLAGCLWIGTEGGLRPLWHRIFGMKYYVDALLDVEWDGAYASLIFYDENWSEYRVLDKEMPVFSDQVASLKFAHGDQRSTTADECMSKERAFIAVREFIETRTKPIWLSYRLVK
jgi:hypothetical protein